MSDKEFGIKFVKTDNGFRIEVNGDEEIVNAHREMAEAWHEFARKVRRAAKTHHRHHHGPFHHLWNDDEDEKESTDLKPE